MTTEWAIDDVINFVLEKLLRTKKIYHLLTTAETEKAKGKKKIGKNEKKLFYFKNCYVGFFFFGYMVFSA